MPILPFFPILSTCFLLLLLSTGAKGSVATGTGSTGPTRHPTEEMDVDTGDVAESKEGSSGSKEKELLDRSSLAVCLKGKESDNRIRITR